MNNNNEQPNQEDSSEVQGLSVNSEAPELNEAVQPDTPVINEPGSAGPVTEPESPEASPVTPPLQPPLAETTPTPPSTDAVVTASAVTSQPQSTTYKQVSVRALAGAAVLGLLMVVAACFGGYSVGKHSVKPPVIMASAPAAMTLPAGATVTEQCEPGLGTQYILPKDIPNGPVYNVYQGKLIGIEYMADLASMEKLNTTMNNLPLYAQKYDHINIMSMAPHGGFPTPHYQVDVMMVPQSVSDKITCGGSSSTMNMSGSTSKSMTSSSMKM